MLVFIIGYLVSLARLPGTRILFILSFDQYIVPHNPIIPTFHNSFNVNFTPGEKTRLDFLAQDFFLIHFQSYDQRMENKTFFTPGG